MWARLGAATPRVVSLWLAPVVLANIILILNFPGTITTIFSRRIGNEEKSFVTFTPGFNNRYFLNLILLTILALKRQFTVVTYSSNNIRCTNNGH